MLNCQLIKVSFGWYGSLLKRIEGNEKVKINENVSLSSFEKRANGNQGRKQAKSGSSQRKAKTNLFAKADRNNKPKTLSLPSPVRIFPRKSLLGHVSTKTVPLLNQLSSS